MRYKYLQALSANTQIKIFIKINPELHINVVIQCSGSFIKVIQLICYLLSGSLVGGGR